MNMAFSPFSIVQEPHAIVCTCFMPKGATYKTQHYLPKYVNIKNMIPIARIPSLCLVLLVKETAKETVTEIENYHK